MFDQIKKSRLDYLGGAVILVVMTCFIFMKDTGNIAAIRHLTAVFLISFFMGPFMPMRCLKFPDGGFGLKFGFGLFICFYPAWLLSALGLCEYSDFSIFASFLVLAILGFVIRKREHKDKTDIRDEILKAINGFAVFVVIFLFFFWIKGYNPLINHYTEQYMDFGFMQTIYRQKSALPMDIWLSGRKLNYYFLGQSICVCLTRLSMNTPEYSYNMILATFTGMVFLMVYELAAGITGALFSGANKIDRCASLGGIIGACLGAFGANPHWVLYGILIPFFGGPPENEQYGMYWYADASAYIRTEVGDPDNGKLDFPAYSLIAGDLHAHVINLFFVLPLIALLLDLCLSGGDDKEGKEKLPFIYELVLVSLLLGYFKGANYWDFAIYFVVTGAVIVFTDVRRFGLKPRTFIGIGAKAVFVTLISMLTVLPFTLSFEKPVAGIAFSQLHTPIVKLLVIWFLPAATSVALIVYLYLRKKGRAVIHPVCRAGLFALTVCAIGLALTPEVVYVDDFYSEEFARFNTMFKLSNQAFVLFAILVGIAFAVLLLEMNSKKNGKGLLRAAVITILLYTILSSTYIIHGLDQSIQNSGLQGNRLGISALAGLRDNPDYEFELLAMDMIDQDKSKVINIVETAGQSYTHQSSLSVYTGACTSLGWYAHEWLWNNDLELVENRSNELSSFYSMGDTEYCRDYLKRYDVDYVFVGPAEVSKYSVDINGFAPFGEIILSNQWNGQKLVLIKIDKSKL